MRKSKISIYTVLNYLFFVIVTLIMLYPFWYVVMYSFSDPGSSSIGGLYLIPDGFSLQAYEYALSQETLYQGFFNSVFLAVIGTGINMLLTILMAYPLSRENLPFRRLLTVFVVFPMLFSAGMIPTYLVIKDLGLLDTLWALILHVGVNVYNLLILNKFFKNIPESIIEAAEIDGCSHPKLLTSIVLPMSKASLATVSLFYAVYHWNEFFYAGIYINTPSVLPLQVVLRNIIELVSDDLNGGGEFALNPEGFKMATIVIAVIPILCVYPFLQKYFTKGVTMGAVKG